MDGEEQALKGRAKLVERGVHGRSASHDEDVPALPGLVGRVAQDLTDPPTHAITLDGASKASTSRDAEAVVIVGIGNEADDHEPVRPRATLLANTGEVLPGTECRHGPTSGLPDVRR